MVLGTKGPGPTMVRGMCCFRDGGARNSSGAGCRLSGGEGQEEPRQEGLCVEGLCVESSLSSATLSPPGTQTRGQGRGGGGGAPPQIARGLSWASEANL